MNILEKIKKYRFEIKHLTVLFAVLMVFQVILSFIHKASLTKLLDNTQEWYQKDSAERLANFTSTSFELLYETIKTRENLSDAEQRKIIQAFDIILSQQLLEKNVDEVCILVNRANKIYAIDDGKVLFNFLSNNPAPIPPPQKPHKEAIALYTSIRKEFEAKEEVRSIVENKQSFNLFVPFVPRGEFVGAVYMKNTPNFGFLTSEIISNYDETSLIYSSLILLGLLAMYYISSYTVRERDDTQRLLYEESEKRFKEKIIHEKEALFTRRIYHTHHKAEKVMGFIKEDLRQLSAKNIEAVKYRVARYSNFISRVIYDMKWFDPPVQTVRSQVFNTDLNEVIKFIVENIFLRISSSDETYKFSLELDEFLPKVHINEFVAWEIIEPLIQNSIDHGGKDKIIIRVKTEFDEVQKLSRIIISDDGVGIRKDMLEENDEGVKKIFLENLTTKKKEEENSGYGCYIAYEIATARCGWKLDAENLSGGGCRFIVTIKN